MSFSGKAAYDTYATEAREDLSPIVTRVAPIKAPLLDFLGDPPKGAENTKHDWLEDPLNLRGTTVKATFTAATDTSIDVVANTTAFSRVGDILQGVNDAGLQLFRVTAITDSDTLAVTKAWGGTTALDMAVGDQLVNLGMAGLEGADQSTNRATTASRKVCYAQIIYRDFQLSGSEMKLVMAGNLVDRDKQIQARLKECVQDLEYSFINSYEPASNPEGTPAVPRAIKGIIQRVVAGGNVIDAGTADDLTEDDIYNALTAIYDDSELEPDFVAVGAKQSVKISKLLRPYIRVTQDEKRLGRSVQFLDFGFGEQRIVRSRAVPKNVIIFGVKAFAKPMPYRSFGWEELAKIGDYHNFRVIGEYAAEIRHADEAWAIIKDLNAA